MLSMLASLQGLFEDAGGRQDLRSETSWAIHLEQRRLTQALLCACSFEEWQTTAKLLDEKCEAGIWAEDPVSDDYDYRLIHQRLQSIVRAREREDIVELLSLLRSGLVRNLGNITSQRLYDVARAGTKVLIEDYITQVALTIRYVASYSSVETGNEIITRQSKLDLLHDTRQVFGRTALVLEGSAESSLGQVGVVKGLLLSGLLPRIMVGLADGAFVSALVCAFTEDQLLEMMSGAQFNSDETIPSCQAGESKFPDSKHHAILETLLAGWVAIDDSNTALSFETRAASIRNAVGDTTFEEAYQKTKKVLNIIVLADRMTGLPSLLNYLITPNVLIWSAVAAAVAAAATIPQGSRPVTILCKDALGQIMPWSTALLRRFDETVDGGNTRANADDDARNVSLSRIAQLFNVNHFILAQAPPHTFLLPLWGNLTIHSPLTMQSPGERQPWLWSHLSRLFLLEVLHRAEQLSALSSLHNGTRKSSLGDDTPGVCMTLLPELPATRTAWSSRGTTRVAVSEQILSGERRIWPAISQLKVRCIVEIELDRAYQTLRRRKPMDIDNRGQITVSRNVSGNKMSSGR